MLLCEGGRESRITLALHERADSNGDQSRTGDGKPQLGKKEALRRGRRYKQRVIRVCHCGRLHTVVRSGGVAFLHDKRSQADAEAAGDAEAVGDVAVPAAKPSGHTDRPISAAGGGSTTRE